MSGSPILVTLDRPREVRWTNRAQARNSSLERPAAFTDLAKPRRRFYALCAILWAALAERNHPFAEPEDLAEYLSTEAQQLAALDVIKRLIEDASPKKDQPPSASSTSGPAPSSSAGSAPGGSISGS
jgi:hypothetical protein